MDLDHDDEREEDRLSDGRPHRLESERGTSTGSNGLAVAGVVLGVLSCGLACVAGVPAVICSSIAMRRPGRRGLAITGLVLGIIGTVLTVPFSIGLLLTAVAKVRQAATRSLESNNLKQVALSAQSEADAYGNLFGPYARNSLGLNNRGLSFRVNLLPFMEQFVLFKQFDRDQDWNSPSNRPFSETIVAQYASPFELLPTNNTHVRVFVGGGALFNDDGRPVETKEIKDGASNTILYVYAGESVPWAKPEELAYSPDMPLPPLGPLGSQKGTIAAMADASVRYISPNVSEKVLRAAITRAGGESMTQNWWDE